ncbi:MAG: GTPase HflX [Bacteroidota bacterium]|nr:GTPase HflX [Bacteroidota bacterium]
MKEITVTKKPQERSIVVAVKLPFTGRSQVEDYLEELVLLADTAGSDIIHRIIQERDRIESSTFIGSGKANEIAKIVEDDKIDLVIFNDDLSQRQVRNLEKIIKCKIVDRSGLILDIFASRAKSKEAMTQVELAQLQYLMTRLTRQWTHLSKQYGGIGTKGPGETQIETDRRAIRTRIKLLKDKLHTIEKEREVQRKGRKYFTRVALVGYTNAGKSTLMNTLSSSDVFVEDRLFATLDTTVRTIKLPHSQTVLLSDTVGFIRKLPPHLIASFKSTLAEVTEADILLHVVDVSHPLFEEHIKTVESTIEELESNSKPMILVFNKVDSLKDRAILNELRKKYKDSVSISALRGINIPALKEKLLSFIVEEFEEKVITTTQSNYRLISKLHEISEILETKYLKNRIRLKIRLSRKKLPVLEKLAAQLENKK